MKRKLEEDNNEKNNKKQKIYEMCPICLENMKDNNLVITECNHKFCFTCLMKSCENKNECPLCRSQINHIKIKKLPIFRNVDLFDNICDSIGNPIYNLFSLIDKTKRKIFDLIRNTDEEFDDEEYEFKELIIDKLDDSQNFSDRIDLSLMDDIQVFINNIIIRNTFKMINWYEDNFQ